MDDEDSQEELINRCAAPGKKTALALVSDEEEEGESDETGSEDESEEDGEEAEEEGEDEDLVDGSDSGEDDDDDEEDDDDEDDEVEGEDEEEDEEELEGAVGEGGARTTKLATNGSRSSDEEEENCPICLNAFRDQVVGTPENCNHYFCLDCIVEWAKNATSCPVDRTAFSCICIRAHFGGVIIKKVPVENHAAKDEEEEDDGNDTTNCEVCGRCDREDRLLLCDGCDAGYHMECLNPPLNAIPVDEWFCPECAITNPPADEEEHISEAEVSSLTAEVQPVASRLRTNVVRTRAIARTRQSERVRENVNRLRTRTTRRNENVPRFLTSSLLDETIEAVVAGLNTAVYQRPLAPHVTTTRRKKTGRRRKGTSKKKPRGKVTTGNWMTGKKTKKRRRHFRRRKGRKTTVKKEVSTRTRIAKTLGLCKPVRGVSIPAVRGSAEPSLGLLRSDIGAAALSVFGDPFALDPYDSQEDQTTGPPSPMSTKRRVLSRSALRSHQPVARPISVGMSRRGGAAAIQEDVEPAVATPAPISDLLGSILSEQNRLMMSSSDIVINRDGSLLARKSANTSSQKNGSGESREGSTTGDNRQGSSSISGTSTQTSSSTNTTTPSSSEQSPPIRPPSTSLFPISPSYSSSPRSLDWILNPTSKKSVSAVKFNSSFTPRAVQVQNIATAGRLGVKPAEPPRFNGNNKRASPSSSLPSNDGNSSQSATSRGTAAGHPPEPGAKRIELSELPRIPKIKREVTTGHHEPRVGKGGNSISDAYTSRLTGKGESRRPSRFTAIESSKPSSSKDSQETFKHVSSPTTASAYSGSTVHASGDKGSDSTARSAAGLKITINPGSGPSNRLFSPSMSSPFRPVESKSQTKSDPSPNCPISKKEKLVKNEIYDPFDPTGSNSSSACSSPEREEPSIPVPEHIKSSPDGSPTSPDGSPTSPVSLNSPVVTQASPDISQTSPDVARTSPDITRMVPEVTRTVPDVPRTVPDLARKAPEVIRTIPEVSMVFPEVTRVFTEVNRVVPEVNRSFPEVTRKYPEVTRNVPEVKMTFPKVTMKFPDATRKFSDVSRKFSEVTRKFPEINRTFPEVTRTFPEVSLKFPDVTRKLSEVTRTFPEVTSKPPDITRTFPGISRSVPEVTRTFPSDPTKPGAFRSFRLLTTSTKVGISGLGSDFSDAPPTKIIHRDVLFEEPIKDGGSVSEGDKDLKKKDTEQEKGGKESYKNFHASVTVKLSPERIKSVEVPRTWHDKEQRTLVSVKSDPDVPPAKNKPQKAKRPYKDTKSRSRSRSNSSSRSRKKHKKEKKLFSKERKKKRSRSRSRSQSKEQISRSASWSTEDERAKKSRHKNKGRKLSSEHSSSSSHERLKKKKIKEIKKSKKKSSSSKDRRKTRSRSVSHGSSSSEFYESKKKKKRKSRSRERSRSSSVDREKRRKRKSEKNYDRYDKESSDLRFRERRRSKEKKKAKSRSTSPQIAKEYKRARSKEKWQTPKDRTVESKEIQLSPHRVVKLTGTYVENIPKLTVSYVENIPRRTVHSLVVNPDAKDPFKVQRRKELSDTSLETDSDAETSDEDNKLKDGIQPQVVKEASSEAVSLSGENESSPCESPDHLYNSPRLDVTDSVGSGIDSMHSDVKHEMTAIKEESIVQTSVGLKCSDREVVSHSPTHGVPEAVVSSDVPIEKGEDDDVDKMLDDNLNLVHSATVLLSEAAQKDGEDDSQNKLSDGMQKRLGNCDNFQLGFNAPDKLIEDAHAKFAASAPVTSSEDVHDKPGFGTLQLEDKTHESDSETDAKLGSDADSEVDDKVKKDEKQEVDKVIDEDEVEHVEDNSLVEGVAVDLLDNGSLQQVDDCSNEQVNSFSGNQAALISHDQPSNRSGHDFNCSADHIVDDFTDQKDDSSVHEEDLAVCRSDSFVPSGADEFVDRGMDNYSGHVVDGDPFYQGDRFADHQGNRLGDHQGDRLADHHLHEFSGHQITESDGPQEDRFEDQRMGDFGGRSMEEFARHLLDKFAGHGIGDFTCPKVTDVDNQVTEVAGSQVTIIPGIGMGDVTDYHEEDTAVCQDDDYTGEQSEMDESSQSFLKSKQQVKRVTWNLQEEDSDTSTSEKTPKVPFYKLLRSKEDPWKAFDPLSQTSNPVYSPDVPLTPPLPSTLPPFTPVSEPSAHYVMHESLPLLGCMAGSTVTSESGNLATASEPGMQSASTWDAEEKTLFHKPSLDRITQEYLKKLHIQERAVEEVKLAIKPFYQTREITKDEYKDILRKAVSKICHSKSGEINPVKVSNLIRAYVERYKHLRKHKREIEEYHDMGPESP